ncbi:hypothetical protein AJ78_06319 [Emergomyces pasteurianus Ep9510]|uniref:Uncharacterized protein n=1 Tax=Emergomyces pasteurianus Ep9510 TaxID=1447872 RepID=A0A1J9P9D4_9EURO|nr:hypothetical protein AJ78_06319 [Emergomyces pasteurianus Ep9510]
MSENVTSTVLNTKEITKDNRRPTNKNKKSTSLVLGLIDALRVIKARRKTKLLIQNPRFLNDALVSSTLSTLRHGDTGWSTRAHSRVATATMNRVKDLKIRRNEQPETKLRENRQKISRAKSQRLKKRASKDRNISSQAKPQGITKS